MGVVGLVLWTAAAQAGGWRDLIGDSGWDRLANRTTEFGSVSVDLRYYGELPCLRGTTVTDMSPDTLYGVVSDVPAAVRISSADVKESKKLRTNADGSFDYYQFLAIPLVADRFWVIRGRDASSVASGGRAFAWERLDADTHFPTLRPELSERWGTIVETPINYGVWTFKPSGAGTEVRYHICTDSGGTLPQSIQQAAARSTMPDNIADVIREAKRRASR
jgi:hypothetical protein